MFIVSQKIIPIINDGISAGLLSVANQYDLCLAIATFVFAGVTDRQEKPYIQHCIRVSKHPALVNNIDAQCVGLLHDVLEDSDFTKEDLLALGVKQIILEAVESLSKHNSESYPQFIERLIKYSLTLGDAGKFILLIKLSDIEDNSQIQRNYLELNEKGIIRRHLKYMAAYARIKEILDTKFRL